MSEQATAIQPWDKPVNWQRDSGIEKLERKSADEIEQMQSRRTEDHFDRYRFERKKKVVGGPNSTSQEEKDKQKCKYPDFACSYEPYYYLDLHELNFPETRGGAVSLIWPFMWRLSILTYTYM